MLSNMDWVRSKVEALKVLLDHPAPEDPKWALQYVTAAGDLRDFWNASGQEPLVREFTEEDWQTFSNSRELYGGHQPVLGIAEYKLDGIPCAIIGDHNGVEILMAGSDESLHWDQRGVEYRQFVLEAIIEKIIREQPDREALRIAGFVRM